MSRKEICGKIGLSLGMLIGMITLIVMGIYFCMDREKTKVLSQDTALILVDSDHLLPSNYHTEFITYKNVVISHVMKDSLDAMMRDACLSGHCLTIESAYRGYLEQEEIFKREVLSYIDQGFDEKEAYDLVLQTVSLPGTSDHQTGLAIDFKESRDIIDWLHLHAYEYGFISSLESGSQEGAGHFRFVGVVPAREIHRGQMTLKDYLNQNKKEGI